MLKQHIVAAATTITLLALPAFAHGTDDHTHEDAHGAHEHMDEQAAIPDSGETWSVGGLTISTPYSRATLPNAPVAGGFLTIENTGSDDDRLIAAESDAAGKMEIHEMLMDGDIMKMQELADGLALPAGETIELQPGGYHLMFMDLQRPLVEGDTVNVTLTFETAGTLEIPLTIGAFNRRAGDSGGDDDEHKGH